jgi:hypothetical protein
MKLRRLALASAMLCVTAPANARELTREFLAGTAQLEAPVAMSEYTPAVSGSSSQHRFEGRLRLSRETVLGRMTLLRDDFGIAGGSQGAVGHLPEFDFEFVQSEDTLIPVRRGSIAGKHGYWEYILEPGRVWSEPADGGLTRAALPFSLQERNANCIHNGVLTFLFDREKVSRVAYQIGAETCAYFKADLWGVLPAQFIPGEVGNRTAVIAAYSGELAARLPTQPIAALAADYPIADPNRFGSTAEIDAADMTAYGFVIDNRHYTGGCQTRQGPYPFCDVLDLPSYSLAKTLFAGLATLRLERLYPGTLRRKIGDYVPECRNRQRWGAVTFEHALDMATGNYSSLVYEVDENSAATADFFLAEDHAAKIHIACHEHPHRAPAGTTWAYHTTDTYILGTALNAFVKERVGGDADLYESVLVRPLWHALNLSPVLGTTRRTLDLRGQPFVGWGLVMHRDDIARIGRFLGSDRGQLNGAPFFDEKAFAAAMQLDPADRGLAAIDASFRYNNGFWAHDVSSYIGCRTPVWVPYMAGYGGISVLLLPNNTVYYYFSDGGVFRWSQAVVESNRIRPLCQAAS